MLNTWTGSLDVSYARTLNSFSASKETNTILEAIVIYGPQHVPFDVDLGPIMLHDWRHLSYEDVVAEVKAVRLNDIISAQVRFLTVRDYFFLRSYIRRSSISSRHLMQT